MTTKAFENPARTAIDMLADVGDLVVDAGELGRRFLESLQRNSASVKGTTDLISGRLPSLRRSCSCEIPPPCWMPRSLGAVRSHVCAGASATLRVRVTNCGVATRKVDVEGSGVTIAGSPLLLGAMESGVVVVSAAVAGTAGPGETFEHLVWVRGCNEYFVRWFIRVDRRGCDACHEIDVQDCPDLIHHWYDHFYCARPCAHGR